MRGCFENFAHLRASVFANIIKTKIENIMDFVA